MYNNSNLTAILAGIFVAMSSFATISEAQNMNENQALSAKQQSIIPIAAFTATVTWKN